MLRVVVHATSAVALVFLLLAAPARSAEVVVQNDSLISGTLGTPCLCFISGEEVAAWLTAPCGGDIVAVQVYWGSQFGGNPQSLETAISVLGTGTFPAAGSVLQTQGAMNAIVVGPTLTDGQINEFRFLDPGTMVNPLQVPVVNGQTFVVSLELLNTNSGAPFASTVVYDTDGCQAGRNAVNVMPGGWTDACLAGVTGDFMIRAVVDCSTASVPALSTWSAALLVLLLLAAGAVVLFGTAPRWARGRYPAA
jgi:hypothetical protein